MAYNPVTGQYDPDTNDFSSWYNQAGQQQQQQTASTMNNSGSGGMGTIGDGSVPVNTRPQGVVDPTGNAPAPGYPGGSMGGLPYIGDGTVPVNDPNRPYNITSPGASPNPRDVYGDLYRNAPVNNTNNPYIQLPPTQSAGGGGQPSATPASALPQPVVGTGNPGNDPNNPPGPGYFWSGTAHQWVDPTYQHDATGRVLSPEEQAYWKGQDTIRAQNTAAGIPYTLPANPTIPGVTPAATTAQTTPAAAASSPYDYSKQGSVPYYAFEKNVYADTNAQQSFRELQGTNGAPLTPQELQVAQQAYGWQKASDTTTPDANTVYASAIALAKADPNSDYSIVRVAMPDGSTGYGILKRENGGGNVQAMQQAQTARGFISPAVAIQMAQERAAAQAAAARSGGGGSAPRTTASLPRPQAPVQTAPAAQVSNNPLTKAGNVPGQVINYNGDNYQWTGTNWVRYNYNQTSPRPTGPQLPKMV